MKNNLKMLLAIIQLILISLLIFSCNYADLDEQDEIPTLAENDGIQEIPTEEVNPLDSLPSENYDGYEFKILVRFESGRWDNIDFRATEDIGEPINDAVYYRNKQIEEKYNIIIKNIDETASNVVSKARTSILAGDNAYDVIMPLMGGAVPLANEGHLYNLLMLPNLDLEQSCWDQNAVSDLSINNKLYVAAGDLMTLHHDSTNVCIFNKNMVANLGLESPYQLVKDNKWTFDKLSEMISNVTTDLNGDGKLDRNDRFGLMSENNATLSLYNASGERMISKDKDDLPVLSIDSERSVTVIMQMMEFITNQSTTIISDTLTLPEGGTPANVWEESSRMFSEGKVLFRTTSLRPVRDLREMQMEDDFGIIPLPKFDEAQSRYYHSVQTLYNSSCIAVPINAENPSRTGLLLQAICMASTDTVRKAYYDINLLYKVIRDEDSAEMLDIIFASRIYDIGYMYNWGNVSNIFTSLATNKSLQVVSEYEKVKGSIENAMNKTVEQFLSLEN